MSGYAISREAWQKLSLFEQMGNIGSEVGRTFSAQKRQDEKAARAALERALDLLGATIEDKRLSQPRLKEVLRAKEEFLTAADDVKKQAGIENYFMQFAIAARRKLALNSQQF